MSQVSYGTITITDTNDIERIYMVYAGSSSDTAAPDASNFNLWKADITQVSGDYIWQRTVVKKSGITITSSNFQEYYGDPVCITGPEGAPGEPARKITKVTPYYCLSTSSSNPKDGSWSDTPATYPSTGTYYYWTKTVTTYDSGSPTESTPVLDKALNSANKAARDANQTASATQINLNNYIVSNDAALDALQTKTKYFWTNLIAHTNGNDGWTKPNYLVGTYAASGIDNITFDTEDSSTYGYNTLYANGIKLRYNAIDLGQLTGSSLIFYNPSTTSQGKKAMELSGSVLKFYASDGTTPQAEFGGTKARVGGTIEALDGQIGGWNIGTDTNKSLYTGTFNSNGGIYISPSYSGVLDAAGITSQYWAFTAGNAFGVTTNGNLYANEAHINGKITATSLTIESKAPVSGLSTSNIDGMNNYALQESLDSEITQRKAIYAVSTTEATIAEKTTELGTPSGFVLYNGATVTVKFDNGNSTTTPTLNVNGTGEKTIKSYTGAALAEAEYTWPAGVTITFTYDGSYWRMQDGGALQAKADAATAKSDAATAQSTADTAKKDAATAQSAAETAKKNAATAQTGVDTLNTYIRRRDDGVEVARKDADGNYVGYKTIQTANGLEVRTADGVLVARYGSEIWLTNGVAEGFRVEFGSTLVPIKEIYPAKIEATGGETGTWTKTYTTRWAADQASGVKVSGHIYAAYASAGNLKEAAIDFDLANGESKTMSFSDGVQAAKASVSVAYLSSGYAAATISIEIGADNTVLSNVGISYASPKSDVCMATLGTHPDTSTPAVFRIGNGTTGAPSNALVVDWNGNVSAGANMYAKGIALDGTNISSIFSGAISIGYEDKSLSIAAGGNTGEATINLAKDGYSARCICGWNLSGTGSSNCVVPKLFLNQTEQKIHYYVKNTGSSKATPKLRAYVLYTKSDLPKLQ